MGGTLQPCKPDSRGLVKRQGPYPAAQATVARTGTPAACARCTDSATRAVSCCLLLTSVPSTWREGGAERRRWCARVQGRHAQARAHSRRGGRGGVDLQVRAGARDCMRRNQRRSSAAATRMRVQPFAVPAAAPRAAVCRWGTPRSPRSRLMRSGGCPGRRWHRPLPRAGAAHGAARQSPVAA